MKKKKKSGISRRAFLTIAGGSGAAFLLKPQERFVHKLVPYVHAPDYPKPGEWTFYTTTCRECPAGCGLLMWHRDGRVTKAEGNPANPINKGKICIRGQSSVLGLYDESRIKSPLFRNNNNELQRISWEESFSSLKEILSSAEKVKLLSNLQTGSLSGVMQEFGSMYKSPPLYYEAFNYEAIRKANRQMYGHDFVPTYDLSGRDLIVSFGADFLETWISPVEYARAFGDFHSLQNNRIGKFIYFGSAQTMTAVNSDEFIIIEPGTEADVIEALSSILQNNGRIKSITSTHKIAELNSEVAAKLQKVADDISAAQSPLILAGQAGDADKNSVKAIQAANNLNERLGNKTDFSSPHALSKTAYRQEISDFFENVDKNTVLIIHDSNPAYSEPAVKDQLMKAGKIIYIGSKSNETSAISHWILPAHYTLEDWGDYESRRGSISLMQPVMKPVYDTKSAGDILLNLIGEEKRNYRDIVKDNWRKWAAVTNNSLSENENIEIPETAADDADLKKIQRDAYIQLQLPAVESLPGENGTEEIFNIDNEEREYYLQIFPSHYFYDGKLANRGWLQEIPHPVSNIVWQSWIDMNADEAAVKKIEEGEIIRITSSAGSIEVPVRLTNNIHQKTLAIDAGQGHEFFGDIASGIGVNAFLLTSSGESHSFVKVDIEKTGKELELLYLNQTKDQQDRELLRHEKLEKIQNDAAKKEEIDWPMPYGYEKSKDIYKGHEHKDHRWGMVIDLQKCIGCKACEAACYAENNIPVVGKEHSREGREMSWLKVVPYRISEKQTAYLPVPCQHCDTAPCEPVCPVYASHHTEEGLNAQIYNRCIGTRYCSNNCPYKVRRFNWSNFKHPFPMNLQLNPEVTVRDRGVMEKCTFCVQRIRNHEYQAKIQQRELKDGEIQTACMQTCPTNAIYFGDLMNENSEVRKMFEDDRKYQLLHELNTKTAVIYLKKITQTST